MSKIAIYLPNLSSGGAERQILRIIPYFIANGHDVELVVNECKGSLVAAVPVGVNVYELGARSVLRAIRPLQLYLSSRRPDVVIANMPHCNLAAIIAAGLVRGQTKVIITEHNHLESEVRAHASLSWKVLPLLYKIFINSSDAVIAVSQGVSNDLRQKYKIEEQKIHVVYNPAVPDNISELAERDVNGAIDSDEKYVIAIGRLVEQKDYNTLLTAVSLLPGLRVKIIGEGHLKAQLIAKAQSLGIHERVLFVGFVDNPYPYIRCASALILSSRYEGFGNVVAEALALGVPVVSTDCRYGPAEILEDGKYGYLVPVGDSNLLAESIRKTLKEPVIAGLKERGAQFMISKIAPQYLRIIEELTRQ